MQEQIGNLPTSMDMVMVIDRESLSPFNLRFKALWEISTLIISFLLRLSCSKNRHSLLLVFHAVSLKQKH